MLDKIREHKFIIATISVIFIGIIYFGYVNFLQPEQEWIDISLVDQVLEEEFHGSDSLSNVVENEVMMVDVKGAVKFPGVYEASIGDRAIDLIEKAGGLIEGANSQAVNFAMKVTDEMVIYVPTEGEEIPIHALGQESTKDGTVNINTANEAELQTLPGIGPLKAQAIIEYRTTNGEFKTIEEIMNISGIGEKTFEKLKNYIRVK